MESKFLALLVRQNQIMLEIQIAVMLGSGFEKDTLEPLIAAVENTRVLVREIMKEEFEPKPLGDFSWGISDDQGHRIKYPSGVG